jgi:hypothetical protein
MKCRILRGEVMIHTSHRIWLKEGSWVMEAALRYIRMALEKNDEKCITANALSSSYDCVLSIKINKDEKKSDTIQL